MMSKNEVRRTILVVVQFIAPLHKEAILYKISIVLCRLALPALTWCILEEMKACRSTTLLTTWQEQEAS